MDRNDLFDVLKLALWRQGTASADVSPGATGRCGLWRPAA